ncbi:hypothetical protein [Streptomyces sp. NPDC057748]|uniref:hypothetical protein n=1 Tax=unclassified Streptomyces TaxID=2593676 RepID=UPI0036A88898
MTDTADQPTRVTGDEAKRIKREALGIADRKKHHDRATTAMMSRAKEPGTSSACTGTASIRPRRRPSS